MLLRSHFCQTIFVLVICTIVSYAKSLLPTILCKPATIKVNCLCGEFFFLSFGFCSLRVQVHK
jgi:hypothetical protein